MSKKTITVNGQELPVFIPGKKKVLEKDVEADIGKYAKEKGCLYEKFTSPNKRSVPDRIITTPHGVIGFLEIKRPGESPTIAQQQDLDERQRRGCNAEWASSVETGKKFIDMLMFMDATKVMAETAARKVMPKVTEAEKALFKKALAKQVRANECDDIL